ncbi:Protein CBG12246 [Caenorhabditis briggsae]|uniref:Protein CBG12246 n=1 Tax=Caenorhabditis briggsae TaxID=6238 RepID=A8XF31_CAEBR|nr:Protein CBG12246 [Caenorhabditis briggsae]CAP31253.1 Protein CBG12246 [Caenorhabditis briggsae]
MSLFKKCVDLNPNFRKPLDIGLIWEGNYWDDQDVHDCCDVDWDTVDILIRKISKSLHLQTAPEESGNSENPKNPQKILIFLPKILQLPLTILAGYHAGFQVSIMNPLTTKSKILKSVILAENPKFLISVDAFWQAQELIEVKNAIEPIISSISSTQLLIIRHVSPNPGVPPPKKHFPARRPSYRTQLDLHDGRDWEWSTVMAGITVAKVPEDSSFAWKDDDVIFTFINENGKSHPVSHTELLDALEARKVGLEAKIGNNNHVENFLVLDFPENLNSLVDLLIPWYMGKTLTLYEGPPNYPDSSRLAQIISKHNVNMVLGESSPIPNPEYLKFFKVPSLKFIVSPQLSNYFKS